MADIENIPLQDNYDTTLTNRLEKLTTALTIEVKDTPSYTPTNTPTKAVINPGKSNAELVIITDYDATNRTITIEAGGRAQPLYKGDTGTLQEHVSGSQLIISDNYAFWNEIAESVNSKADQEGLPLDVYANAAARDAAIPSPSNGMQCYLTDTGLAYDYLAGSWVERSSGGTFPNASETVAGKVEIATEAQALAGEDTGTTGAKIVMTPANGAITDVAQTAAGYIPKTNATGVVSKELVEALKGTGSDVNSANLDILTNGSNADTLHSHIGSQVEAGEAMDGSSTPKAVWIADTAATRTENPTQLLSTSSYNIDSATKYTFQSVTFSSAVEITEHKIYVNKVGSPSDLICEVYESDGSGEPTGSVLSTETGTESAGVVTFTISPTVAIGSRPKQYCFRIKGGATANASNYYAQLFTGSDEYSGGDGRTSDDSGATWSSSIGDFKFDTTGTYPQVEGLAYLTDDYSKFTGFISASYPEGATVNVKTDGEVKGFTLLSLGQYYKPTTGGELTSGDSRSHCCLAIGADSVLIREIASPMTKVAVKNTIIRTGASGTSQTVVLNHGLGVIPDVIKLTYRVRSSPDRESFAIVTNNGSATFTTADVMYYNGGWIDNSASTTLFRIEVSGDDFYGFCANTTVDINNLTITDCSVVGGNIDSTDMIFQVEAYRNA